MILCTADETVNGPALHLGGGFSSAIEWMTRSLFLLPPLRKGQEIKEKIPSRRLFEDEERYMRVAVYDIAECY